MAFLSYFRSNSHIVVGLRLILHRDVDGRTHLEGQFILACLDLLCAFLAAIIGETNIAFLLLLVCFTAHDDRDISYIHHLLRRVLLEDLAEVLFPVSIVDQDVNIARALSSLGFTKPV